MHWIELPFSTSDAQLISAAVTSDELLVIPTDTVYGIGANPHSSTAVNKMLNAKGRGRNMPSPVLVPSIEVGLAMGQQLPPWVNKLVQAFWPGALTLIFKRSQLAADFDLGETTDTIAVRMPDHQNALEVLSVTGPLAVSSANSTGNPPATSCQMARNYFGSAVSVYCDGGPTSGPTPSTIVDATTQTPVILRAGNIDERTIKLLIADDEKR
ncbi:MAG: L-threonylcarbamoyladenylate synthase [Actinomycetaceae bacterium]|nr:L-threonylcarbamoyladenylate synthase [Actinomycetaceae bacterium]